LAYIYSFLGKNPNLGLTGNLILPDYWHDNR
jgi:hypothetical protein